MYLSGQTIIRILRFTYYVRTLFHVNHKFVMQYAKLRFSVFLVEISNNNQLEIDSVRLDELR